MDAEAAGTEEGVDVVVTCADEGVDHLGNYVELTGKNDEVDPLGEEVDPLGVSVAVTGDAEAAGTGEGRDPPVVDAEATDTEEGHDPSG